MKFALASSSFIQAKKGGSWGLFPFAVNMIINCPVYLDCQKSEYKKNYKTPFLWVISIFGGQILQLFPPQIPHYYMSINITYPTTIIVRCLGWEKTSKGCFDGV